MRDMRDMPHRARFKPLKPGPTTRCFLLEIPEPGLVIVVTGDG